MPTPLPSSFASAAAGQTQDPNRRGDGGEWYASCPALSPLIRGDRGDFHTFRFLLTPRLVLGSQFIFTRACSRRKPIQSPYHTAPYRQSFDC